MDLFNDRTHFLVNTGHVETRLLKRVTDEPLSLGSVNTSNDKTHTSFRKVGV
jgi:hypothetical protein